MRTAAIIIIVTIIVIVIAANTCSDNRSGPSPAYEAAITSSAESTCRMIRERGGISPARCTGNHKASDTRGVLGSRDN